jgi:5'-phosphate synthase pdxT subunit
MTTGLLGLQGAFQDHIPHLHRSREPYRIVRSHADLQHIDRLILPGGESTVMTKFLIEFGMLDPLRVRMAEGMPVWGICAGAILLARQVDGHPGILRNLDIHVTRNAYGRQIASSQNRVRIPLFNQSAYPAIFIRAPRIDAIDSTVTVHASMNGDPVFVQSGRIMATTFHPELNPDSTFHHYFLTL